MGLDKKTDGNVFYAEDYNDAVLVTIEAGENITSGNVIYIHLTDGKAYVSDTGTANDIRATGLALTTATAGNDVVIIKSGVYTTTGLTDKQDYYLGAAGAMSTTLSGVRIGTALSTTKLFIDVRQDDKDMIGTIKAYHKSMTGIPSNNFSAFWVECDGATLSDSESPLDGEVVPDMNTTQRMIRGASTSGTTGGADQHTHGHSSQIGPAYFTSGGWSQVINNASSLSAYFQAVFIIKIK